MLYTSTNRFPGIAYRKFGEGPVVVLLHGFPADGTLWENIEQELPGFTTIVPDFPGTGSSKGVESELTIEDLADFVFDILQHENIEEAVIAGHSMGGYAALAFAEEYPAMVKGISMVHSATEADSEEKKIMRKKVISVIRNGGKEAFMRQMVPGLFSNTFQQMHPDAVTAQIEHSLQLSDEAAINFYTAMMNRPDRTSVLDHAAFPVQWILGKDDTVIPFTKAIKQTNIANINFVNLYKDCGHMSMAEQPTRLAADLKYFAEYCYKRQKVKKTYENK